MRDEQTLRNLLRVIIQEWGSEQVHRSFAYLSEHPSLIRPVRTATTHERKLRPSPSQLVEKSDIEPLKKVLLAQIAKKYETRQFLPSTSDVREFLFILGDRPNGLRDRKEAFRILLQSLSKLTVDRLQYIEHNAEHSGPSQLGPLSNAIANVGASHHRIREDREREKDTVRTVDVSPDTELSAVGPTIVEKPSR